MNPTVCAVVAAPMLLAMILPGPASAQPAPMVKPETVDGRDVRGTQADERNPPTVIWENRGQPEFSGVVVDLDAAATVVVGVGGVGPNEFDSQWFVRGVDRRTGTTIWEDRYGPVLFATAKDVAVEGHRAFVAGWTLTPGEGFAFVIRAYDLNDGTVLWSHAVSRGVQCGEERLRFARCVAKAVDVHDGRVFVVGHLTRTSARSDFAVLAFDAITGTPLWESVTDPKGTGANDYAWAVKARGNRVFVLGEIGDMTGLLLRSYDAMTGAIQWEQQVPGATNYTIKDTLAVDREQVYIGGADMNGDLLVRAYSGRSGALRWADQIEDGERVGVATALTVDEEDGESRLFATGVIGCDPATFLDCKLAVRAYKPRQGLIWQRADDARGGDWFGHGVAVGAGRVFVDAAELLEDGQYHATIRAHTQESGELLWDESFDPDSDPPGFVTAVTMRGGRMFVGGMVFTGPVLSSDLVLRMYRISK